MSKIPTAEEFLLSKISHPDIKLYAPELIAFAKIHLEAQAKAIAENAKVSLAKDWIRKEETIHPNSLVSSITIKVDEQSILNAYPLDNIK